MDQQDRAFLYFMIPFAVLMAVAVPIIVLWTRMSLPKYVGRWNRKKGPPESGQTVSLVLTDVEGSTELWEAFQEVSFQSINQFKLHFLIMRTFSTNHFKLHFLSLGLIRGVNRQ